MDWLSAIREIIGSVVPFLDSLPAVRAILGFILVFFLPGFAWTLVFFNASKINIIERLALSVGLSIAVVALSIFALNRLIGFSISGLNAVLTIIAVTIIPMIIYGLKRLIARRESNNT